MSSPSTTARPGASAPAPVVASTGSGALKPVRRAVRERFGAFGKDVAAGLALRHDHSSQYVSHDFQAESRFLGIESSPALVREPEGDGHAGRFVRAPNEDLRRVRRFATVGELRLAPGAFRRTRDRTVGRHGDGTPAQVRSDQLERVPMAA